MNQQNLVHPSFNKETKLQDSQLLEMRHEEEVKLLEEIFLKD
jgi:hypothetical protein